MSISGNLRDFDISYIYQIISQENKTGRLALTCDEAEVHVIFNRGKVIYAGDNRKNLPMMLTHYAQTIKQDAAKKIQDLSRRFKGDFKGFANQLVSERIVCAQNLTCFIEMTLEDLACDLFFWEYGYYHFDVLTQVDHLQYGGIGLSADAITMEAARRLDEWRQMRAHISNDTVFIKSPALSCPADNSADPLTQTPEFILRYIDGASSVGYLCKTLFLSEYRIVDSLQQLKNQDKIIPLSDKYSRSIHAALERGGDGGDMTVSASVLSSLIVGALAAVVFFGGVFIRERLLRQDFLEMRKTESHLKRIQSENKISIASLLYHAQNGTPLTNIEELVREGYIAKRDLPPPEISSR